jgi:hypothetical protein
MLCENSTNKSNGLNALLWCNIINSPCLCYRYCTSKKCVAHTNNYNNCPYRAQAKEGEQMGRPKKSETEIGKEIIMVEQDSSPIESESEATASPQIEEELPKTKKEKPKNQKQICKVLYKTPNRFAIDFNGDGISFRDNEPNKTDKVEISFIGTYKQKDFEIISHKFI